MVTDATPQPPELQHTARPGVDGPRITVRLLGPVRAELDGQPVELGGPRARAILALLALTPGQVVAADDLLRDVWGDEQRPAVRRSLHAYLSRMRKVLEPDRAAAASVLTARPPGYELRPDLAEVDAPRFTRLAGEARAALEGGDSASAVRLFDTALELWDGAALADLGEFPALRRAGQRLDDARLDAEESRAEAVLALDRTGDLTGRLQPLVAANPHRERLAAALVHALLRGGRRAEALEVYARARRRLVDDLGVEPGPELAAAQAAALAEAPAGPSRSAGPRPSAGPRLAGAARPRAHRGLPTPLTGIVGRDADLVALERLLASRRLVTLIGAGGCGKTRLAVEVARRSAAGFSDGVAFAELAGVAAAGSVAEALAAQLGVVGSPGSRAQEAVVSALGDRELLLVLDGCEHVIEQAAALVEVVLADCPALTVLATSREAFRLEGETARAVEPLGVPPEGASTEDVLASPAMQLLLERVPDSAPDMGGRPGTVEALADICRQLDGIPLALELAASRLGAAAPQDLAGALGDRFRLLRAAAPGPGSRPRTLYGAVAWSHDLLPAAEREAFDRLSVFAGRFDLAAAAAMLDDTDDVLDVLDALVSKSLVVATPRPRGGGAPRRYRMLDTFRAFGRDRLDERGELAAVSARHAAVMLARAERAEPELRGPRQRERLTALEADVADLEAALSWLSRSGDVERLLRLGAALAPFWYRRGRVREGRRWLAVALEVGHRGPALLRSRGEHGAGLLAYRDGDLDALRLHWSQAVELAAMAGDPVQHGITEVDLAWVDVLDGKFDVAAARVARGLARAGADAPAFLAAEAELTLGLVAWRRGDLDEAAGRLAQASTLAQHAGDDFARASARWLAGKVALERGDVATALAVLGANVAAFAEVGDLAGTLLNLHALAAALALAGDAETGAVLLGAVAALGERIAYRVDGMDPVDAPRHQALIQARLSPEALGEACARGRALSAEDAVRLATTAASPPSAAASASG